jgi:hypothetical protein
MMAFYRMSQSQMEQVCALANIRVRPCKKTVTFYNTNYPDTVGFDIVDDGRISATYAVVKGEVRIIYPRGGEYTHTSTGQKVLGYHDVLLAATRKALAKMSEAVRG